jgi:hypothetical protein
VIDIVLGWMVVGENGDQVIGVLHVGRFVFILPRMSFGGQRSDSLGGSFGGGFGFAIGGEGNHLVVAIVSPAQQRQSEKFSPSKPVANPTHGAHQQVDDDQTRRTF